MAEPINIVTIAGSPSRVSKSSAILEYIRSLIEKNGLKTSSIIVRDLNPEDLIYGRLDGVSIKESTALLEQAAGVVIATPIYKGAYSGVLKTFLDLLPQNAMLNKVVLPIATGASPTHFLAIDYALKPVLSALGATNILTGIYILDSQIKANNEGNYSFDEDVERKMDQSLNNLITNIGNLANSSEQTKR